MHQLDDKSMNKFSFDLFLSIERFANYTMNDKSWYCIPDSMGPLKGEHMNFNVNEQNSSHGCHLEIGQAANEQACIDAKR